MSIRIRVPGAWAAEAFEPKSITARPGFLTIRRRIVGLWDKNRRKTGSGGGALQAGRLLLPRLLAVASLTALLAACGAGSSADGAAGSDSGKIIHLQGNGDVAATVNGTRIPATLLDAFAAKHGLDIKQPEQRKEALDNLVQYVLVAQQADKLKMRQQPDLAAIAESERLQGVANAVLAAYDRSHPVTEQMVADDYARQTREAGNKTYRFTQLLFDNKADADKAAAELAAGKPFKDVYGQWHDKAADAQQYSGVFPRQLPDPLAHALTALKPDQTTPQPVQSKVGWHLLHLDGIDDFQAPPLAQVEAKVRRGMQEKQAKAWVQSLKDDARITVSPQSATAPLTDANSAPPGSDKKAALSHTVVKDKDAKAPATSGTAH